MNREEIGKETEGLAFYYIEDTQQDQESTQIQNTQSEEQNKDPLKDEEIQMTQIELKSQSQESSEPDKIEPTEEFESKKRKYENIEDSRRNEKRICNDLEEPKTNVSLENQLKEFLKIPEFDKNDIIDIHQEILEQIKTKCEQIQKVLKGFNKI